MMKIKYLKNAPLGQVGDIADVADDQAKVLITLGIAEAIEVGKAKPKRKKTDDDKANELDL